MMRFFITEILVLFFSMTVYSQPESIETSKIVTEKNVSSSFQKKNSNQNLENKTQIIDYLGIDKYNSVLRSNPAYLKFLNVRLSNGHLIVDYVEEKMADFPVMDVIYHTEWKTFEKNGKSRNELLQVKITPEEFLIHTEREDFNFLEYKFTFDRKEVVYHVLGNTGKVIVMLSTERINEIVNKEN